MAVRVLLVDDNPSHIELLRLLLDLEDPFAVVGVADDGESGACLAGELQPDIIVSDIEMPRLDGLEAVARYRQAAPQAAVVLMSSQHPADAAAAARRAGADLYIDKGTGVDTTVGLLRGLAETHLAGRPPTDLRDAQHPAPAERS